jgi:hypothetical protein
MHAEIIETPIYMVKDSEVKWEISYEIHPIQLQHAVSIAELISNDPLFEYMDVNLVSNMGKVTSIVLKAEKYWFDLAAKSHALDCRLDELFDAYLASNGGYAQIQA